MKQQICILGSTGSIGTQALDVIAQHPDRFEVYCLTANNRVEMLAEQARQFNPAAVIIANDAHYDRLKELLSDRPDIKVYAGPEALNSIVEAGPIDMVLTAMVGFSGLNPTIHAIKARKKICLANKETLVVAGELICQLAAENYVPILPVDSEHSAIFQSIVGEGNNEIEKILLTASGGPFRKFTLDQMRTVTAADALKHPTWEMGAKITIDSASMMNKGFEVIEAARLFGVSGEQIEVVIHRESIIHSMVEYNDNAVLAQLSVPDMRLCIQYALSWPGRPKGPLQELDFTALSGLTFAKPDTDAFPLLSLAYHALAEGGVMPAVMNAADERAVSHFLAGRIRFGDIDRIVTDVTLACPRVPSPSLSDVEEADAEARRRADEAVGALA